LTLDRLPRQWALTLPGGAAPCPQNGQAPVVAERSMAELAVSKGKRSRLRLSESKMALIFLVPAFVAVGIFLYYPLLQTFIYSIFDLHRTIDWLHAPFVGIKNYVTVLTSQAFRGAFGFTIYFTVVSVTLEIGLGLGMAMATFSVASYLRGFLRAVLVVPWAIPPVVSAMLWKWLYHPDAGLFGYLVHASGLTKGTVQFLTDPVLAVHSIILADVWKNTSIMGILLLGGLAAISKDVYDAAKVDGARGWFRFRRITLPLLLPTILVCLLFRSLEAFRMFELSFALTGGGPGTTTDTLSTFAYKYFFTYARFGVGSSYAMVIFAIVFALAIAYVSRIRRNLRLKG
jgi:multiple sugar transport system permease protein